MTNEQAIEQLQKLIEFWEFMMHVANDDLQGTRLELEALRMAVQALKSSPRWIPCSERMPEMHKGEVDGEFYKVSDRLLFSSAAGVCCGFYEDSDAGGPVWYEDYVGGPMWYSTEGLTCENVTAWMPMPEVYSKEQIYTQQNERRTKQ